MIFIATKSIISLIKKYNQKQLKYFNILLYVSSYAHLKELSYRIRTQDFTLAKSFYICIA